MGVMKTALAGICAAALLAGSAALWAAAPSQAAAQTAQERLEAQARLEAEALARMWGESAAEAQAQAESEAAAAEAARLQEALEMEAARAAAVAEQEAALDAQAEAQAQALAAQEAEIPPAPPVLPPNPQGEAQARASAQAALDAALAILEAGHPARAVDHFNLALDQIGPQISAAQAQILRERAIFGRAMALFAAGKAEKGEAEGLARALSSLKPPPGEEESGSAALARASLFLALDPPALDEAQMAVDAAAARGLREDGWRLEMLRGELAYRLGGYEVARERFIAAGRLGAPAGFADRAIGDSYMAQRKWSEAEAAYRTAYEARPSDAEALMRRIRAREAQRPNLPRDGFDPLTAMELAGSRGASGYAFLAERGALRRAAGKTEGALADLREALRVAPPDRLAMARYAYGSALVDARRWTEADELFRSIDNQPEFRALLDFQRGRMLLEGGEPARALTMFERSLALRPGDPSALFNRAVARLRMGQEAMAEADFAAAAARDPMAPDLRDALGRMKFRRQPEQALAFYDAAVLAHPQDPESWTQRAGLMLALGRPDAAAQDSAAALKLAPDHAQAALYMAEAQLSLGDAPAALDYIGRIQENSPQSGRAALIRARARLAQGSANAAMQDLDHAELQGAPLDEVALARGDAAMALKLSDTETGAYFDQAVALSGGSAAALEGRARFLMARGMSQGALRDLSEAIAQRPDDPNLLARRGELNRLLGQCEAAQIDLDKAFTIGLKNSDARRARAACRLKDGHIFSAMGDFLRAMF